MRRAFNFGAIDMVLPPKLDSVIYFLMRKGVVVYVGQSKQMLTRIGQHWHGTSTDAPKNFDSVKVLPVPQDERSEYELMFYLMFMPEYNAQIPTHNINKAHELMATHGMSYGDYMHALYLNSTKETPASIIRAAVRNLSEMAKTSQTSLIS